MACLPVLRCRPESGDLSLNGATPGAGLPPEPKPPLAAQQPVADALLSRVHQKVSRHLQAAVAGSGKGRFEGSGESQRDLEAGSPPGGGSPPGSAADEDEAALQELRLRVLGGMKRHFRAKRLAGLLSPDGLRVAKCVGGWCVRAGSKGHGSTGML